jgi:hypothetical protein
MKKHREEDPKQYRGQDAVLLQAATHRQGLKYTTIETDCTVHVLVKESYYLKESWGHNIFCKRLKSPLLLTRSKALVRSMVMHSGFCCSRHFSCSWRNEIISTVDQPAMKPHCDSGYTREARLCRRTRTAWTKTFPTMLRGEILR